MIYLISTPPTPIDEMCNVFSTWEGVVVFHDWVVTCGDGHVTGCQHKNSIPHMKKWFADNDYHLQLCEEVTS